MAGLLDLKHLGFQYMPQSEELSIDAYLIANCLLDASAKHLLSRYLCKEAYRTSIKTDTYNVATFSHFIQLTPDLMQSIMR